MLTLVSHGPAGSGPALMMQALAAACRQTTLNQAVRTIDLPSADGAEAINYLGERAGDGTVLGSCTPTYLTTPLKQHLPWTSKDFTAISGLVTDTYLIAVRSGHPRAKLSTLFAAPTVAAAAPYGGNTHIQALLIGDLVSDVEIVLLPSAGEATEAVARGAADWTTGVGSDFAAGVQADRLQVVGTFGTSGTPTQPALADVGINIQFPLWRGVVGPPGLRPNDVTRWQRLLSAARATDAWRAYVADSRMQESDGNSNHFRRVLDEEQIRYAKWIQRLAT